MERSMLGRPLDALVSTRADVYALTHALMYVTDLGSRRPRLPRSKMTIEADGEAALAWCMDEEDYDLVGEVLLSWPLLRRRWSAAATFGFSLLSRIEDAAGFLPSGLTCLDRLQELVGEQRSRYALETTYHTAFVMALLCAAILHTGCAPPKVIRPGRRARGAAAAILELMDQEERNCNWRTSLDALDRDQQDALADLLLAIYIRRAASQRKLERIQLALRIAARFYLMSGPAPRQAAELLQRACSLGTGASA
jgi:hypothetical protein